MARRGDGTYQRGSIWIMLASLCALLGVATSAEAAQAWVLWERQLVPGANLADEWVIRAAWPEWSDCKKEEEKSILDQLATKPTEAGAKVNRFGNSVTAQVGMRVLWSFKFVCLPDTVDPRGPKGK
jgi:hypothetical protein